MRFGWQCLTWIPGRDFGSNFVKTISCRLKIHQNFYSQDPRVTHTSVLMIKWINYVSYSYLISRIYHEIIENMMMLLFPLSRDSISNRYSLEFIRWYHTKCIRIMAKFYLQCEYIKYRNRSDNVMSKLEISYSPDRRILKRFLSTNKLKLLQRSLITK